MPNGQRSQVVELGGRTVAYAYDDAQRLISEIITGGSPSANDSYTYDAFGSHIATSGSTPNRYSFTGEQLDNNLGMYYLWARHYNPTNGHFL